MTPLELAAKAKDIIAKIEHGDSEHRAWLYEHSLPIITAALMDTGRVVWPEALEIERAIQKADTDEIICVESFEVGYREACKWLREWVESNGTIAQQVECGSHKPEDGVQVPVVLPDSELAKLALASRKNIKQINEELEKMGLGFKFIEDHK